MDDMVKRLRANLKRIFDDAGGSDTLVGLLADLNLEGSADLADYITSTAEIERVCADNTALRAELARVRALGDAMAGALVDVEAEGLQNHNTRCRSWWPQARAALAAWNGEKG